MTTYEILRDRGMITRHYGRECLSYYVDIGGGRREHKTTTNLNKDIEVERVYTPLEDRRGARLGIALCILKIEGREQTISKEIEDDKERAFIAVVTRLQDENIYPKRTIHVWVEENPSSIHVYGECKI